MNGTKIYFRGFRILNAVLDHLKTIGLKDAKEVILTGCSGTTIGDMTLAMEE